MLRSEMLKISTVRTQSETCPVRMSSKEILAGKSVLSGHQIFNSLSEKDRCFLKALDEIPEISYNRISPKKASFVFVQDRIYCLTLSKKYSKTCFEQPL